MSYFIYGVEGEVTNEITLGRWIAFEDDETAQAWPTYQIYLFAAICDSVRGEPRMIWSQQDGWVSA